MRTQSYIPRENTHSSPGHFVENVRYPRWREQWIALIIIILAILLIGAIQP